MYQFMVGSLPDVTQLFLTFLKDQGVCRVQVFWFPLLPTIYFLLSTKLLHKHSPSRYTRVGRGLYARIECIVSVIIYERIIQPFYCQPFYLLQLLTIDSRVSNNGCKKNQWASSGC